MSDQTTPSVHASAVKVGSDAVLIRGPSGSGKSRLAFDLILAGRSGQLPPTILVADDRVRLATDGKELWARTIPELAGLIEIFGLGIRRCEHVDAARIGLVVDLAAPEAERLPPPDALQITLFGVSLPRIPVAAHHDPLPLVVAALTTTASSSSVNNSGHCEKGIGNHISPTLASE
jgi:HPr kinase/phosphorylase